VKSTSTELHPAIQVWEPPAMNQALASQSRNHTLLSTSSANISVVIRFLDKPTTIRANSRHPLLGNGRVFCQVPQSVLFTVATKLPKVDEKNTETTTAYLGRAYQPAYSLSATCHLQNFRPKFVYMFHITTINICIMFNMWLSLQTPIIPHL
jgi:hypothetical protein